MEALFGYWNFLLLGAASILVLVGAVLVFFLMVYGCLFIRYKFVQYMSERQSPLMAKRYFAIMSVVCIILTHLAVTNVLLFAVPGLLEHMAQGGSVYVLTPAIAAIAVTLFVVTPLVITGRENDRAIGDWKRGVSSF